MSRQWFKVWAREWVYGDLRSELTAEERALWTDLLAMAALSPQDGVVCETERNGYSFSRLAAILSVSPRFFRKTIEKLSGKRLKMVTLLKRNRIKIRNWRRYQSEYGRQKGYRQKLQPELQGDLQPRLHPRSKKVEEEGRYRREKARKGEYLASPRAGKQVSGVSGVSGREPPCLPASQSKGGEITEEMRAAREVVWSIPGWPKDEAVDTGLLKTLSVDYPEVEMVPAVRAFQAYCIDKPLEKKSRPRLRLTNWFQTSRKFGQNIRAVRVEIDSSATDKAAREEVERLERRLGQERSGETEDGVGRGSSAGEGAGEQPDPAVEDNRLVAVGGNGGGEGRDAGGVGVSALQCISDGVPEDYGGGGGGLQPVTGTGLLWRLAGGSAQGERPSDD